MDGTILTAQSPRLRTLKQLRRNVVASKASQGGSAFQSDDASDPDQPPLGMVQLFSYYAPGLQGGVYNVKVNQHVEHSETTNGGTDQLDLESNQQFDVNAPRFTLPPGIVHQTYPPQGLGDHNNVLPHIVFEDPHLPWEQEGSPSQDAHDAQAEEQGGLGPRNMVPWVALLSFTEDEIKLAPTELLPKSLGGLFPEKIAIPPKSIPPPDGREQNKATFSMSLTMGEYLEMAGDGRDDKGQKTTPPASVIAPIRDNSSLEPIDREQQVEVVYIPTKHFEKLVSSYDGASGSPIPPSSDGSKTIPDVSRYKYLAHVRNVNTRNMANAGLEDNGLYSVVHADRTGPLDITTPKPVIVHLVTLEGIESHLSLPLDTTKQRVALVSLYSWTYLCLPPDDVNFVDTMTVIANEIKSGECWLRAPGTVYQPMLLDSPVSSGGTVEPHAKLQDRLARRMQDGYTLTRYLLQTGEETVALFRGPLTPTHVPQISEPSWPYQSNFSTDYQIVDRQLGIMDITYSAAWQLGRTLGIADQAFCAALVRLRGDVQTTARRQAQRETGTNIPNKSKMQTFASLSRSVNALNILGAAAPGLITSDPSDRFTKSEQSSPKFALGDDKSVPAQLADVRQAVFRAQIQRRSVQLSSAKEAVGQTSSGPVDDTTGEEVYIPFNDINIPNSSDWQVVQTWILDNLFLKNIPAHYLIPDASFLPREAMRFFYIDQNWMDAFIDGALSIGNHLDRQYDVVRQAFKRNLNRYFATPFSSKHLDLDYHPQIPCFGFLLRSSVVKAFPNLEVHAPWPGQEDETVIPSGEPEPTLRLETLEKDVLLCLFDRMPGSPYWSKSEQVTIQQPPQQQCFRLGTPGGVTATDVEIEFRRIFTTIDALPLDPNLPDAVPDRYGPLEPTVNWVKDVGPLDNSFDSSGAPKRTPITDPPLPQRVFDWDARTIVFPAFANACNAMLTAKMTFQVDDGKGGKVPKKYFNDDTATSAVSGTMLTSFISKMKIQLPEAPAGAKQVPPDTLSNPRLIRLPKDEDEDPMTWKIVPHDSPATPPKPSGTQPPAEASLSPAAPAAQPRPPAFFDPGLNPPIPPQEQTNIPASNPGKTLPNQIGPQFSCRVFPLGQKPPQGRDVPQVPMSPQNSEKDIPIDLVVGLTAVAGAGLAQDTLHNLQLYSVIVDIPMGTTANHLIAGYTGSGGKMLSNLRFNVHVSPLSDRLRFTLIPRATTKLVPLRNIPELSFIIWQVRPNGVIDAGLKRGEVRISVQENYRRMDSGRYFTNFSVNRAMLSKVLA